MKHNKSKVHFVDSDIQHPTNPVSVTVIGAGGTGSKIITGLMEMNHSLNELGHPGLSVRLWDDDTVAPHNIGRQRFAESETGLYKSVAIINRANRWSGTHWKAEKEKFQFTSLRNTPECAASNIYISCIDSAKGRTEIAQTLIDLARHYNNTNLTPKYWLDLGNGRDYGQGILATIGIIKQPDSKLFEPAAVLPSVADEYASELAAADTNQDTPSCSTAESLSQQNLYINSAMAVFGCNLLWELFCNAYIEYRGFFVNLKNFRSQPIPIG